MSLLEIPKSTSQMAAILLQNSTPQLHQQLLGQLSLIMLTDMLCFMPSNCISRVRMQLDVRLDVERTLFEQELRFVTMGTQEITKDVLQTAEVFLQAGTVKMEVVVHMTPVHLFVETD